MKLASGICISKNSFGMAYLEHIGQIRIFFRNNLPPQPAISKMDILPQNGKMKFIEKNHLKFLKLSKFTPSTAQQSAAHSDERLQSYGQKTEIFAQKCILGQKFQFFGHDFVTAHRHELPIGGLYSG